MKLALAIALTAACGDRTPPEMPPDAPPLDELAGFPTIGPRGQAGFGVTDTPIAQRAGSWVFGRVRSTAPALASVTSDDTAILAIDKLEPNSDLTFLVTFHAPGAGDTDLVLRDGNGAEIDRLTLHVRPSDALAGAADALVLAGAVERLHLTTMTAGKVTVGTGAVAFQLSGDLTAATDDDAPWIFGEGDDVFFRAADTGAGAIAADAPNTTAMSAVTIVPPSALTAITTSATSVTTVEGVEANVGIAAVANGAQVHGVRCTWSNAGALAITLESIYGDLSTSFGLQDESIGGDSTFVYSIHGPKGTYHPVCTVPGGLSTTIGVQIN
jgi:hypothetical protein